MDPALVESIQNQVSWHDPSAVADPFAPDAGIPDDLPIKILTPQEAFEKIGISFGKHGSATYDPESLVMKFELELDQANLIPIFFESIKGGIEKHVFIQLDKITMSNSAAEELLNSSIRHGNHEAEHDLAQQWVRNGKATRESASIVARSGNRSQVKRTKDGTTLFGLEVDPVLGADNYTIDLKIKSPQFSTSVTVHDGVPIFLGLQEETLNDRYSALFATASIQSLGRYYVIVENDEEEHDITKAKKPPPRSESIREFVRSDPIHFRVLRNGELQFKDRKLKTFYYRIPEWFFRENDEGKDDTYILKDGNKKDRPSAQSFFESKGIVFGGGAYALYDPDTQLLKVNHRPDQIDLIDAYLNPGRYRTEKQISVRVETYRLHPSHGHQVLQSVMAESNHKPERDAIRRGVGKGFAKLESLQNLTIRGGQIGILGEPLTVNTAGEVILKDDPPRSRISLDPVLGPDNQTIDLNIQIESSAAENRRETIDTQLTLHDGTYTLIAAWINADHTHTVVFVSSHVQFIGDIFTRMVKVK